MKYIALTPGTPVRARGMARVAFGKDIAHVLMSVDPADNTRAVVTYKRLAVPGHDIVSIALSDLEVVQEEA